MSFPFQLTEDNLRRAMRDRRYSDRRHSQYEAWRGMVAKGWATNASSEDLRGELRAKIADMKTNAAWVPRSMTDDELRAGIESNERAAKFLEYGGAVPGAFGKASAITSDIFRESADRMRAELVRRIGENDHH